MAPVLQKGSLEVISTVNMLSLEARGLLQNPIIGMELDEMSVQALTCRLSVLLQAWRTIQGEVMEDMKSLYAKL